MSQNKKEISKRVGKNRPPLWCAQALEEWKWPPKQTVAEWSEANRVLTREQSDRWGPWRNSNAPYGIGIMDALQDANFDDVIIKKAAQVAGSEIVRCWLGYIADRDPDPAMLVWPVQEEGRKIFKKRVQPLFEDTPCLRKHHDGFRNNSDLAMLQLRNGFMLRLAHARSPSSLKSDPIRFAIADEVDEFPAWVGKNADAVSMIRKRMRTYGRRRKFVALSTPTHDEGNIEQLHKACTIKVRYHVPCPHCGRYQVLIFARLEWEGGDGANPDELVEKRQAEYRCALCEKRIHERHKPHMVQCGAWATDEIGVRLKYNEHAGTVDDHEGGQWQPGGLVKQGWAPSARRIGFHISGMICLWVSWSEIVAEKIEAAGDQMRLQDWVNQTLGEPFQHQVRQVKHGIFKQKCSVEWPSGLAPDWATALLATVDVQEHHVYCVVRAWGERLRSRRIWHGKIPCPRGAPDAFDELNARVFNRVFEQVGGGNLSVTAMAIDRNYRTEEVDQYARSDVRKIYPIRGSTSPLLNWARSFDQDYVPPTRNKLPMRPRRHEFDPDRAKTWLVTAIEQRLEVVTAGEVLEADQWELNSLDDPDYNRQMSTERKVAVRDGGKMVEKWIARGPNHYFDCEAMQRPLLWLANLETYEKPERELHWSQRRKRVRGWG